MPTDRDHLKAAWRLRLAASTSWAGLCKNVLGKYLKYGGPVHAVRVAVLYDLAAETGQLEEFNSAWRRAQRRW